MRFAIIADVFGNWPALEAVLRDIARRGMGPRDVVCLGNLVGPCGQSRECAEAGKQFGLTLRGECENLLTPNADRALRHADSLGALLPDPHVTLAQLREELDAPTAQWLSSLPYRAHFGRYEFNGAIPEDGPAGEWADSNPYDDAIPSRFYLQPRDLAFVGPDGDLVVTESSWLTGGAPRRNVPHTGVELTGEGTWTVERRYPFPSSITPRHLDHRATGELAFEVGALPLSDWHGQPKPASHTTHGRPWPPNPGFAHYLDLQGRWLAARRAHFGANQVWEVPREAPQPVLPLREVTSGSELRVIQAEAPMLMLAVLRPSPFSRAMEELVIEFRARYPQVEFVKANLESTEGQALADEWVDRSEPAGMVAFREGVAVARAFPRIDPNARTPEGEARHQLLFALNLLTGAYPQPL